MKSSTFLARIVLLVSMFICGGLSAQDATVEVRSWLAKNQERLGLSAKDVAQWNVTSQHTDKKGISYIYIQQQVSGLPIFGAVANFAVRNGEVISFGDRLIRNVADDAPAPQAAIDAVSALRHAAQQLDRPLAAPHVLRTSSSNDLELSPSGISRDPIPVRLIYQPAEGGIRLAWDITIRSADSPNWWHLAVDAITGEIIRNTDHMVECAIAPGSFQRPYRAMDDLLIAPSPMAPMPPDGSGYRVFPFPTESPSHGPHVLVSEPANVVASPHGWHDTNGQPGAEHTITRGNNAFVYEDLDDIDMPGYSPSGGPTLSFDHPFTPPQAPLNYLDASITNLFYTCNVLHDVWYHYGFDEQSGNFQSNNYDNGGLGFDEVIAEGQDGGGMNNANFGTPPDGSNGRMQMYLWRTSGDSTLFINSPASIAGVYENEVAGFGPPLPPIPITADLALVQDAVPPVNDGCETLLEPQEIAGKIALVDRGQCTFVVKVQALQDAGAVAVIVVNNVPGDPIGMGGTGGENIVIPSVMISQADGLAIKLALSNGPVNATLVGDVLEDLRDSGFDNGIIAHEYGHGVSNRLTGGGQDVDCLWSDEQMGEGWSDYMGLVLTIRPDDTPATLRGVGTFVRDQAIDGQGIRPAPYTTDVSINGYTYDDTNNDALSQPHGVGFVWATMLWDMTWALIGEYGFDPDMYTGNGGNNLAIQLMMDGLKLQPCNPGFVDGRDAILLADVIANNGVNECLIWNAFAQRGLGHSADQGSAFSRFDQVEAFDVPPACLNVGIEDAQKAPSALTLMPNPASNEVTLSLSDPMDHDAIVRIMGMDGRVIGNTRMPSGTTTLVLDITNYASALYVVELRAAGLVIKERLVVQ